jgi:mono/diheme cytochrome c family protein
MKRSYILLSLLSVTAGLTLSAIAQERANSASSPNAPAAAHAQGATNTSAVAKTKAPGPNSAEERALRLEGEKRFRTNCGRCHQAPHKFPPRVMAAAIRHMRVRAMITDEDMRLILRYMTQ